MIYKFNGVDLYFIYLLNLAMKKTLISLAWIVAASVLFGSFVSAELFINDVFDVDGKASNDTYSKILTEYESNWWYTSSDTVVCDAANGWVSISSPVISDADLYDVDTYRIFLSPYRVSQLKNGENVDISNVFMKEFVRGSESPDASISLSTTDGLDSSKVYYGFLLPITVYDEIWTPSSEFCFKLDSNMCLWDEACNTIGLVNNPAETETHWAADTNTDDQHNAACVWMDLANVSHTVSNNVITLKWTSLWDGSTVQIAIFDPEEEIYKSLWSVSMDAEKFDYRMQWDGEQNFSLTNWCKEVYYKADASRSTPTEPEKVVTPATWPAENILIIAIVAIALYGLYAIFFRKSENN